MLASPPGDVPNDAPRPLLQPGGDRVTGHGELTQRGLIHEVSLGPGLNAQEQEAATKLATEHARNVAQNEWANDLDRATRPLLEKIVAGQLSDADREDCRLLESQLRDQIRGRALASAGVLQAARAARSRGVRVDIFDDRGSELPPAIAAEAHAQLTAALVQAEQGSSVKGRALPADADIAVTILSYSDAAPEDEIYVEVRAPQQEQSLAP